jgi:transglutaminase-like putative cysteine protease
MILEIIHDTIFEYDAPVTDSYVELRLTPLVDRSQHLLEHRPHVVPPCPVRQYVDFLGNTVSYFNLLEAHTRMEIRFESLVETFPYPYRGFGIAAEERESANARLALYDFLQPTPLTAITDEFHEFICPLAGLRGAPPQEAAEKIGDAIFTTFRYEGAVTNAASPIADMLRHRAGVCQDFAHLMLASCRFLGFPARYSSGYVLGAEDTEQEVASHAWVQVFDPDHGWFGVDPTHNKWVEDRYVRLGVGRDYRDVPPNRGLYRGAAKEDLTVRVVLRPLKPEDLRTRRRARTLFPRQHWSGRPKVPGGLPGAPEMDIYQQQQQQQQQ